MEIDTIKDLWNAEMPAKTPEISLEKQKEIRMPLEKIRKNMRSEFYKTIIAFVFIIAFMFFKTTLDSKFVIYLITMIISMVIVSGFYFFNFFKLYNDIGKQNFSTKENLKDLLVQFRLNTQYYLSYYLAFVPFLVCEMALIFIYLPTFQKLKGADFLLYFSSFTLASLLILFFTGKFWFSKYYGQYIRQVEELLKSF